MSNEKFLTITEFQFSFGKRENGNPKISRNTIITWLDKGLPKLQAGGQGKLLIPYYKALKWLEEDTPDNIKKETEECLEN